LHGKGFEQTKRIFEMKPTELRINNWVMYDGRYFQIDSVGSELPFLKTIEFGVGVVTYDNIQPIPLTEEILLKCGFNKRPEYFYGKRIGSNNWLEINISEKRTIIFTVNGTTYVELINVKHLNELQNLFYSLSGEELNIQL